MPLVRPPGWPRFFAAGFAIFGVFGFFAGKFLPFATTYSFRTTIKSSMKAP